MYLRTNLMQQKMRAGDVAIGCSLNDTRDPSMVRTVAEAGADYVFIDLEHFPASYETASSLINYAHAYGITPLVRIPDLTYESVTRLLDSGAQTLFVPHLRTPAEVHRLIELAKYHPIGRRGMALYGREVATDFDETVSMVDDMNSNVMIGLNIETREAVENLDEMLIDGIDFALVGYQDLAQTYGIIGQYQHPLIQEAKEKVESLCRERGIFYGAAVSETDALRKLGERPLKPNWVLFGGVMLFVRQAVMGARAAIDGSPA